MTETYKKIYRSRTDRMFSGLCAGIGHYIGVDPTIVRLIFVLAFIAFFPFAEIAYLIMMIIVPEEPQSSTYPEVINSERVG